jgi:short chain dehydrogenase
LGTLLSRQEHTDGSRHWHTLPQMTGMFNLVAFVAIILVTTILAIGIKESANFNSAIVIVKVSIVLMFIGIAGRFALKHSSTVLTHWTPFIPGLLTGIVPYTSLNVSDPVAVGIDATGVTWASFLVKVGAIHHTNQTLTASGSLVRIDGDIGKQQTAADAVEAAIKNFGTIDVLVNNAGIFLNRPFTDFTIEDSDALVSTNLLGFFYMTQRT